MVIFFSRKDIITILLNVMSVIVIALALYICITPFIPAIVLKIEEYTDNTRGLVYQSTLAQKEIDTGEIDERDLADPPEQNTLVIPSIYVDGQIIEGESSYALNNGIWRPSYSSTPDQGGNTVLIAHRYLYTYGPNTFYHLPKVQKGDSILIFWNEKEYLYEVYETFEVTSNETHIESPTKEPILTLYTCTPLWTATRRHVVRAKLIEPQEAII